MESLKAAVGLGDAATTTATNETKGHEPISGVAGAGTADQPYDSGNVEDSHLAQPSAASATAETTDVAAPLKSLAGEEPEAAPSGGILASLASAVGLGGSSTSPDTTTVHDQGQEPISGMTGQGTVDHSYDAGNEDDPSLGGKANTLTSTNDGLQFIGGTGGVNTGNDHTGQTQSHTSIAQAVNEGALGGSQDPAQSNDGLAFVSGNDKHPTEPLVQKTSNHEPVGGTSGTYTIGHPLGTTQDAATKCSIDRSILDTNKSETANIETSSGTEPSQPISNPTASGPDTTYNPEPLDKDGEKPAKTGPAFISSLFSNPFSKRESISGASGEADMDPKTKALPGAEPIPELQDHAVPVKVTKEKRPLPTESSTTPQPPVPSKPEPTVVEPKENGAVRPPNHLGSDVPPGAASPKREKGKGKVYGDGDSNSTRSSVTRNESIATSQTGASTRDSRRFSSHTPGKIPTAGGIVLGERASQDRERRASLAPSGHSAVTSEPQYVGRESLQKVTEDVERAPVVQQPPTQAPRQATAIEQPASSHPSQTAADQHLAATSPVQAVSPTLQPAAEAPITPQNTTADAPRSSTSARVPGTEKGTLSSPPPSTSRFSEQGIRDTPSSPDPASSPTATERKPSLVARIGRKLSLKSSSKSSRTSTSGTHPETIAEKK
ncbi:hypothetical protein Slin15195_G029620 [Septoria linicola]|uniref:Uncharacterized protein n=1 Tax=Septoria linicola TaxID=215465 RepID=A0A9Q9AMG2_9PEZI|nr:hypothetical protein Slin14017_G028650 [Septoria linicola]USW49643.1 hypothetical protein Slin15195_G029620 [Septoria linicola]